MQLLDRGHHPYISTGFNGNHFYSTGNYYDDFTVMKIDSHVLHVWTILFVKAAITFACVGHCKKINKYGYHRDVNLPLILSQFQVHPRLWKTALS